MKKARNLICFLLVFAFALCACGNDVAAVDTQAVFTDVPDGAWYKEAVDYCQQNGIMHGTSNTAFSPSASMTRSMLALTLYRIKESPAVQAAPAFTDTKAGAWYSDAVSWAAKEGIIAGYGGGIFGVNDPVTREQAVTILWRYAGSPETAPASSFSDAVKISDWAVKAVDWAKANQIISGKTGNQFDPKSNMTRAEIAVILYQFTSQPTTEKKILISYFSATGTTRRLAEYAADILQADLYEIVPQDPYTAEDLDYYSGGRADREQADVTIRPAISGAVENMDNYDIILLGYPIWHSQAPRIISTFLESYDFSGKTIIPFCTSHSSGIGSSAANLHSLADTAVWEAGTRFGGDTTKEEVEEWINTLNLQNTLSYDGIYPQHEPYGTGIGAMPGRVVWAYNPDSVEWDGTGYWWELNHFDEKTILQMVNNSIASLGGKEDAKTGWNALFTANKKYRGQNGAYVAGEKIAVKANINGSAVMDDDTSGKTQMSYTNPVLLKALLTSLVEQAGVSPSDITVYDVSRLFPDYMIEMCTEGNLHGIQFVDRDTGIADETAPIHWSYQFSGKVNYLPACVTEADYIINLANLKGHSYGITLCAKNHFGSFINGNMMRPPEGANLHQWLTKNEMGIYSPLVDLTANADLGGKTVLYLLDALICAPSEGASITGDNSRWQQAPFNNDYTSSLFVSQDPIAIDSVGADFLMNEPAVTQRNSALRNNPSVENYLHEAGLVSNPPSGTVYTDNNGNVPKNLGVHEHWNNSSQKLYSRNLGKPEGIELIQIK